MKINRVKLFKTKEKCVRVELRMARELL